MPESSQAHQPELLLEEEEDIEEMSSLFDLKSELQKKTSQINSLEQTIEFNKNRMFMLNLEKTEMKMAVDSLRMELHHYKEREREYKEKSTTSLYSDFSNHRSMRSVRDIDVQTEYSDSTPSTPQTAILEPDVSYRDATQPIVNVFKKLTDDSKKKRVEFAGQRYENPLVRELSYNMTADDISVFIQNNSAYSDNLSSENLMGNLGNQRQPSEESDKQIKKKKKLKHRLLKLMPCVSLK